MNRIRHDLRADAHPTLWPRVKTGLFAGVLAMFAYGGVMFIAPGWFTYGLSLPAVAIVLFTAVARLNDLSLDLAGTVWNVRRAGLVLTTLFGGGVGLWPWLHGEGTPWLVVFGIWGFAMVWLTTPNQPPWTQYVFGNHTSGES